MKKYLLILLLLLVGASPLYAQLSADDRAAIEAINSAYNVTLSQKSFKAEVAQNIEQSLTGGGVRLDQTLSSNATSHILTDKEGNIANLYSISEQSNHTQQGTLSQDMNYTMEMIYADEMIYFRWGDLPTEMLGMFPTEWSRPSEIPALGMLYDARALERLRGIESLSIYPVNEQTILAARQLDDAEWEGQVMQVYEVDWQMGALMTITGMDQILNTDSMDSAVQAFMEAFNNSSASQQFWVGAEDGLLYRILFEYALQDVNIAGQGSMNQTTTASTDFYEFNRPVEIELP